ncbi:MAG: hypothetical protein WBR28_09180 [Mycobacterium sp.]
MTVAAFVLAVIGAITAAVSLTWNIVAFLLQGARPKLTPIIGMRNAGGLVHNDATRDVRESIVSAARQVPPGPLVIGVKVVNAGRAPFHVAEWALRSDPSKTSLKQLDNPLGSPAVPCDIAPSATEIFFTELNNAYALAQAGQTIDNKPQRIVLTVSSGGRTYKSKPVFGANLALGAP